MYKDKKKKKLRTEIFLSSFTTAIIELNHRMIIVYHRLRNTLSFDHSRVINNYSILIINITARLSSRHSQVTANNAK